MIIVASELSRDASGSRERVRMSGVTFALRGNREIAPSADFLTETLMQRIVCRIRVRSARVVEFSLEKMSVSIPLRNAKVSERNQKTRYMEKTFRYIEFSRTSSAKLGLNRIARD